MAWERKRRLPPLGWICTRLDSVMFHLQHFSLLKQAENKKSVRWKWDIAIRWLITVARASFEVMKMDSFCKNALGLMTGFQGESELVETNLKMYQRST